MKIGIFGSMADPQCQVIRGELERRGAEVLLVESQGLNRGEGCSFDGGSFCLQGQQLDQVACWFVRFIMSPLPPVFESGDQFCLFDDWFVEYMQRRERYAFQLSLLLELSRRGVPLVNPPEHGGVVQLKPFQLASARAAGLLLPATLITNDPQQARNFLQHNKEVVYKPSMGGGPCLPLDKAAQRRLDQITRAPVTLQQRVRGKAVRLTMLADQLLSAVSIPSQNLDYRSDPAYLDGTLGYQPMAVPPTIVDKSLHLLRDCGLIFSGLDFVVTERGEWYFLEANSAPIYLDIERRAGDQITSHLVTYLLQLAQAPELYSRRVAQAKRAQSFVTYAHPFAPDRPIKP